MQQSRWKLLFLIFVIPVIGYTQFIIDYNPVINMLNVTYTGCEICALGTVSAVNICECRLDCEMNPSDELLGEYYDCVDQCEVYAPPQYLQCVNNCTNQFESVIEQCQDVCGPEPEPVRTPVAYYYSLVAAWAPIPNDPRNFEGNWRRFDSQVINSSNIVIPGWNVPLPWPAIHNGNNTCYGIGITIQYNDQTICSFTQWECNIIG
jgi:hypothetical protein